MLSRRLTTSAARTTMAAALAAAVVAAGLGVAAGPALAADPGVEPASVTLTLGPGGTATVDKVVHTPTVPPNPDLVFLADTTGSMGSAIANVQSGAATILSQVAAAQPTAQFAVAAYKDAGDPYIFRLFQQLTAVQAEVQAGVNAWSPVGGGGDTPEAGLNALWEIANGAVAFRSGGTRIVVIFGDAVSHDPSNGHSLGATIAALQAADIRVVAVNVGAAGLNDGGQAEAITDATDGVFLDDVAPGDVSAAILAGIRAIEVTVTPSVVSCEAGITLSFTPASRTVTSGSDATFAEGVRVAGTAAQGSYNCVVDFLVDGTSRGYVQSLKVIVPGLAVNDVTVREDTGSAAFTVTLSDPSPVPVTVAYTTGNGTATQPADYGLTAGTLTFAPGQLSRTITVPVIDDAVDEPTETFAVTLSGASGAAITDGAGRGTITDTDRDGVFSCSATVLNLAGLTAARANPADLPCVDDQETLPQVQLNAGLIKVTAAVLDARTNLTPDNQNTAVAAGDGVVSTANVESTKITIGLTVIEIGVIRSTATVSCVPNVNGFVPSFTGASTVANLKINGLVIPVGSGPLTIPVPLVGSLSLNSTTTTGTSLVQRAVFLDTLLTDVVIGEARADFEGTALHPGGNPCEV